MRSPDLKKWHLHFFSVLMISISRGDPPPTKQARLFRAGKPAILTEK
jgi:hypothetical protein